MVFLGCLPEEETWLHPGSNRNGNPLGPCFLLWPGEISSRASSISLTSNIKKGQKKDCLMRFVPHGTMPSIGGSLEANFMTVYP